VGDRAARPDPADDVRRVEASTAALLTAIGSLDDAGMRSPSALPGWTRGHVLTHLARNADGLGNLVTWALTGARTPMYPSAEARSADIEAGAGRPAAEIVVDLRAAAHRLGQQLHELVQAGTAALEHPVAFGSGGPESPARPAAMIPVARRREVEVHRADLDLGYGPGDWPDDFVRETLDDLARTRSSPGGLAGVGVLVADDASRWPLVADAADARASLPELHGPAAWLAAWLLGRQVPAVLRMSDGSPAPAAPAM
jgi:maleylpyruvate isomerase